ncbi:MAG: 50S ribosomal protein L29 [Phycisphaerae bacterium]|jgi:large subunit ribosomal protein L29|nr:50S ribosomal protein L29 [Phycisphaerae bacterium]MCZ2401338.1 50S ribosomal protein L29 [Phycisphaerae bacterium]NUQ48706.1 50S ribosomal protein L29 [Phycisphaerae bacterium]
MDVIRAMKTDELHNELERLRRHLFDLRSQAVTEKLEKPTQLGQAKRSIARILTVLRERNEKDVEQRQAHLSAQAARR